MWKSTLYYFGVHQKVNNFYLPEKSKITVMINMLKMYILFVIYNIELGFLNSLIICSEVTNRWKNILLLLTLLKNLPYEYRNTN